MPGTFVPVFTFLSFSVGRLSPSLVGNLDPQDDRGSAGEGVPFAKHFADGPVVHLANVIASCLRGDSVPPGFKYDKILQLHTSGGNPQFVRLCQ